MISILLTVFAGYLLGAIPSAYIAGWIRGIDMRGIADGRIGAAAAYRNLGQITGALVAAADFAKGVAAVLLAKWVAVPEPAVLLTGLAAIIGHDWSIFIRFKGGKGATTTYATLSTLMLREFFITGIIVSIPFLIARKVTQKSTLITGMLFSFLPVVAFWSGSSGLLIGYPVVTSVPMILKHYQTARKAPADSTLRAG